jgi:twinkle protein
VTEGEIDCLTVSQLQDDRWPVVSIPQGAQQGKKFCQQNLEFLESYDEVVFLFDNDEPGNKAARECALLLSPGKAKIATLPLKDASDMLQAGRGKEVIQSLWEAKVYQPDGILMGDAVWDALTFEDNRPSIPWPWQFMNDKLGGIRAGEFYVLCAGTGIGKSAVCREVGYHLQREGARLGYVALEENVKRTALGLMSIHLSEPLHLKEAHEMDDLRDAYSESAANVVYYDHFGSLDVDNIVARLRYMVKGCDCTHIIFDHLTAVVSAQDADERKSERDRRLDHRRVPPVPPRWEVPRGRGSGQPGAASRLTRHRPVGVRCDRPGEGPAGRGVQGRDYCPRAQEPVERRHRTRWPLDVHPQDRKTPSFRVRL